MLWRTWEPGGLRRWSGWSTRSREPTQAGVADLVPKSDWPYWEVLTVEAFCQLSLPAPRWIVESLIPGDGWTYVIGHPKHGKSILMAQVGDAVQRGHAVLDCPQPVPGPVVYVQSDSPPGIWQTQLQEILARSPMKTMRTPKGFLSIPGAVEKARHVLDAHAPKFVVWDALEHLTGTLSINDEMGAKEALKRLKAATPCTFAIVHHPRKAQEVEDVAMAGSGHHYLAGDASAILRVTKTGDKTGTLEIVSRIMESRTVKLKRGPGGRWVYAPPQTPPNQKSALVSRVPPTDYLNHPAEPPDA